MLFQEKLISTQHILRGKHFSAYLSVCLPPRVPPERRQHYYNCLPKSFSRGPPEKAEAFTTTAPSKSIATKTVPKKRGIRRKMIRETYQRYRRRRKDNENYALQLATDKNQITTVREKASKPPWATAPAHTTSGYLLPKEVNCKE